MGKAAGPDDLRNEQIVNFGSSAKQWLFELINRCLNEGNILKVWRKSYVIAIPKPVKQLNDAKHFRPISLLCTLYKLFDRIILNRLSPGIDDKLIPEQAGFRPGRTCTLQILNLTQYIENGYQNKFPTGSVFVDLSAAYDTVNHRILLSKLYHITKDYNLTKIIGIYCPIEDFVWNFMTNSADEGYKRMVCHRVVYWLQYCSTYILMTNRLYLEHVNSCMLII